MHDPYERPRVEDRTTVTEPLNTINTSHGLPTTPAWRSRAGDDGYDAPAVAARTPVSDPLSAVSNSNPLPVTPAWRTTQPDDEPDR
jgi:hypothetical protein